MRPVAAPGRRAWAISGLITAIALAIPGTRLITSAGIGPQASTVIRTVTVPQPVTTLTVQSYGASIRVTARPERHIQIIETITHTERRQASHSATVTTAPDTVILSTADARTP